MTRDTAQKTDLRSKRAGQASTKRNSVRIADVAREAGVSVATVSRAFSLPEVVREGVRDHVLEVAARLGYTPDPAAKALRLGKSHIVGVVIPTLDHAFFAKLVNSFQEVMTDSNHGVVVVTTGFDNRTMHDRVRLLVERGAQALLVVGKIEDERLLALLHERHIPTVITYTHLADSPFPTIGFDNYEAMRQLVGYLVSLGHRRLVMIAGPTSGNDRQQARIKAFLDEHAERGISEPWHVLERSYTNAMTEGAECMQRIYAEFPQTTAVVCNSDVFAYGVMLEARRLGIRVPQQLSVTGHDDQEQSQLMDPALTTISVPAREMGRRAAEAVVNLLLHGRPLASRKLPANLIIRGSTAPPPRDRG